MRKNRNSFFTESNMNYSNFQTQANYPYPQNINNMPYQQMPYIDTTDNIENRLAKIERQINRLNARVNKLESVNTTFLDTDIDTSSNMYML